MDNNEKKKTKSSAKSVKTSKRKPGVKKAPKRKADELRSIRLSDGAFAEKVIGRYGWSIGAPRSRASIVHRDAVTGERRTGAPSMHVDLHIRNIRPIVQFYARVLASVARRSIYERSVPSGSARQSATTNLLAVPGQKEPKQQRDTVQASARTAPSEALKAKTSDRTSVLQMRREGQQDIRRVFETFKQSVTSLTRIAELQRRADRVIASPPRLGSFQTVRRQMEATPVQLSNEKRVSRAESVPTVRGRERLDAVPEENRGMLRGGAETLATQSAAAAMSPAEARSKPVQLSTNGVTIRRLSLETLTRRLEWLRPAEPLLQRRKLSRPAAEWPAVQAGGGPSAEGTPLSRSEARPVPSVFKQGRSVEAGTAIHMAQTQGGRHPSALRDMERLGSRLLISSIVNELRTVHDVKRWSEMLSGVTVHRQRNVRMHHESALEQSGDAILRQSGSSASLQTSAPRRGVPPLSAQSLSRGPSESAANVREQQRRGSSPLPAFRYPERLDRSVIQRTAALVNRIGQVHRTAIAGGVRLPALFARRRAEAGRGGAAVLPAEGNRTQAQQGQAVVNRVNTKLRQSGSSAFIQASAPRRGVPSLSVQSLSRGPSESAANVREQQRRGPSPLPAFRYSEKLDRSVIQRTAALVNRIGQVHRTAIAGVRLPALFARRRAESGRGGAAARPAEENRTQAQQGQAVVSRVNNTKLQHTRQTSEASAGTAGNVRTALGTQRAEAVPVMGQNAAVHSPDVEPRFVTRWEDLSHSETRGLVSTSRLAVTGPLPMVVRRLGSIPLQGSIVQPQSMVKSRSLIQPLQKSTAVNQPLEGTARTAKSGGAEQTLLTPLLKNGSSESLVAPRTHTAKASWTADAHQPYEAGKGSSSGEPTHRLEPNRQVHRRFVGQNDAGRVGPMQRIRGAAAPISSTGQAADALPRGPERSASSAPLQLRSHVPLPRELYRLEQSVQIHRRLVQRNDLGLSRPMASASLTSASRHSPREAAPHTPAGQGAVASRGQTPSTSSQRQTAVLRHATPYPRTAAITERQTATPSVSAVRPEMPGRTAQVHRTSVQTVPFITRPNAAPASQSAWRSTSTNASASALRTGPTSLVHRDGDSASSPTGPSESRIGAAIATTVAELKAAPMQRQMQSVRMDVAAKSVSSRQTQDPAVKSLESAVKTVEQQLQKAQEQWAKPNIDINRLSDQLYKEFARRIRLEQQRRGL